MKIFSRGTEPAKPATSPATAAAPAAAPKPASPSAPAPAAQGASATATGATPSGVAPPNPDLTAIIEANVKEMSEKIARLASTLEGDHSERADFESKLEKMEDRMRKLSSLTEMISAQYNPFVGAAPSERDTLPTPDVGLAMPPLAMPPMAAQPQAQAAPQNAIPQLVVESAPSLGLDDPFASIPSLDAPPTSAPEAAQSPMDEPASFTPDSTEAAAPAEEEAQPNGVRLWSVRPSFGGSMLMLNWADMLLKHAPSREGVEQMLEYYRNVGWLGEPARDQLLAYVDGIAHGPGGDADKNDWRASIEVHEKSLLFIEKLRALRGD